MKPTFTVAHEPGDAIIRMLARLLLRPPPRPQLLARTLCRAALPPHAQLHVPRAVRPPRYAVLIDAENVPARLAGPIFEEIQQRVQGVAVDRRVYGDFSLLRNEPWQPQLHARGRAAG